MDFQEFNMPWLLKLPKNEKSVEKKSEKLEEKKTEEMNLLKKTLSSKKLKLSKDTT